MHICVLGAGVIGLTSAYYLARRGHTVTVVDRAREAGTETSFANGGQLSYNYVAPLADGSILSKLPGWLLRRDAPLRFAPRLDPHQWRWCLAFLGNCTDASARRTLAQMLPLAFQSQSAMADLRQRYRFDFAHRHSGKLVIFRSTKAFTDACRKMAFQAQLGSEQEACDARRCVEIEPALAADSNGIAGGVYTPGDDSGDCYLFCRALTRLLQGPDFAVDFRWRSEVSSLAWEGNRITAARTSKGDIEANHFVLAMGIGSAALARPLGLALPLYPLRGYSLNVAIGDPDRAPSVSVTDADAKVVYARLGNMLRIAGMADIGGYDNHPDPKRLALLSRQAQSVFPDGGDYQNAAHWAGLRPATPDSKPIVGPSSYANLSLNVGHGALGFTLACGCGERLAIDF